MAQELNVTTEALKTTPPALVALLHAGGMTPSDWVTVLTLCYLTLQIGLLIPRYIDRYRRWRRRRHTDTEIEDT
ncbi:hypothetical protein [Halomonas organivorans]|uniref:Phage holin T7 family, holin superfamily II n=1 Tax=Halomonas organivorans TaxID=257772 RepID=A0A7W5BY76_9GAMM|nr:hypothetical protein [Halomonas organivorans]MBB3141202.1 hypothetical protein [Halomonas organivorans]